MKKSLGVMAVACVLAACGVTVTAQAPAYSVAAAEAQEVDIPPGHMPPPGGCRPWYPGEPPGHQPPAGDCEALERDAPRGAWLLYRPSSERRVVRVR